jgi:hypothetical protein
MAYYKRIIAEIGAKNELNFRIIESREESIRGTLQQVGMDGGGQNTAGRDGGSLGEVSSLASSQLSDTEIGKMVWTLNHLASDDDFLSIEGIKRVRQSMEYGPERMQKIRKAVKYLVHTVGGAEEVLTKDVTSEHE